MHATLNALLPLLRQAKRYRIAGPSGRIDRQGGGRRSPRKGRGMHFVESRIYQPGDEMRHMDWKLTARTGRAHTKVFEETHERPLAIAIDQSAAQCFASRGELKAVRTLEAAILLGGSALARREQVGGMAFNERECRWHPPARGERALLRFIRQALNLHAALDRPGPRQGALWQRTLDRLTASAPRGALIVLVGDLLALHAPAFAALARLRRRHELIALHCSDRLERELPALGVVRLANETGDALAADTADRALRDAYAAEAKSALRALRRQLTALKTPLALLPTDSPALDALVSQKILT